MPQTIIRPNAVGDEENLDRTSFGGETANWQVVDEAVPDEDNSYVSATEATLRDLYNLSNLSLAGTINYIRIYVRLCRNEDAEGYGWTAIKTGGTAHEGSKITITSIWTDYHTQYNTNPTIGGAWTWAQINALQGGVKIEGVTAKAIIRCTQVYCVVDYTEAIENHRRGSFFKMF